MREPNKTRIILAAARAIFAILAEAADDIEAYEDQREKRERQNILTAHAELTRIRLERANQRQTEARLLRDIRAHEQWQTAERARIDEEVRRADILLYSRMNNDSSEVNGPEGD